MTTLENLVEKYGVLLTVNNVAELLKRKPAGFRWSLSQGIDEPGLEYLRSSSIKIGRKIYFPARAIAALIDGTHLTSVGESVVPPQD